MRQSTNYVHPLKYRKGVDTEAKALHFVNPSENEYISEKFTLRGGYVFGRFQKWVIGYNMCC